MDHFVALRARDLPAVVPPLLLLSGHGCSEPRPDDAGASDAAADAIADAGPTPPPRVCRSGTGYEVGEQAFVDRTAEWGLDGIDSSSVSTADLDGDGFADLLIGHGSPYDRTSGQVLLNREGPGGRRTFVDHTEASGIYAVRDSDEQGRSVSLHRFGDVDNDGDVDIFTAPFIYDTDPEREPLADGHEILLNDGSGVFALTPVATVMGPETPLTTDAFFFDQDLDGRLDLATTDEGGQHNAAFDFDNDGRLDLLLSLSPYPGNRGVLFHQRSEGEPLRFEWVGEGSGFYHACPMATSLADFDRDGDLDMVVGTYGCNDPDHSPDYEPPESQPVRFYENVSNENNWVAIRLVGRGAGGSNRQGIGARVRVTAGGVTQTRLVTTASQNASMEPEAWFGLGASCDIDRVEVRWPSSELTVQEHVEVLANYRVEIHEGEPQVTYVLE